MENHQTQFELGRFFFMPGRRLGGFHVEAMGERGVLRETLSLCAKYNARLKHLTFSATESSEGKKTFTLFLDITGCDIPLERLADEIRQIKAVKNIKTIKQQAEGFIADTHIHTLSLGGTRAIIMRKVLCESLIQGIREQFSSGGEAFLYYSGLEMGINAAKAHLQMSGKIELKDPAQIIKNIGASIFTAIGFGQMQIEKLTANPPYAIIRVYNSFECQCAPQKSDKPYSQLIRGIIAGYLTTVLNTRLKIEETKCIAKGDTYCQFEVKPEK